MFLEPQIINCLWKDPEKQNHCWRLRIFSLRFKSNKKASYRDFLPKNTVQKGEKKSNLTVGHSGKHYLSQVIKVSLNSDKSIDCTLDLMW